MKKRKRKARKTIKFSELKRLSFVNNPPSPVNALGRRMTWTGIGWINEGPANGTEKVKVIDG